MAGRVTLDTTFLIDVQRERTRSDAVGPAHEFLRTNPNAELHLSAVAFGEFAEGFADPDHALLRAVRRLHVLLPVDDGVALQYGRTVRELRQEGRLIGANDLWIAATSLHAAMPLVTADADAFARVNGLEVLEYR